MKGTVAFLLCLLPSVALAQIVMPDVIEPYKKIKAGCDCIIPEDGSVQILWTADRLTQIEEDKDGLYCYAWAPPGEHTLDAVVIAYTHLKVFVPDPNFPDDFSKAKVQVVKVVDPSSGVQRYNRTFRVGSTPGPGPGPGPVPPPGPDPNPGPGPAPTDPFAAEVRKWFQALPAGEYSHVAAMAIADNYASVASEAVATQQLYDILAFAQKTKEKNQATLQAKLPVWVTPFFVPLAQYQQKLAQDRKIDLYKDEAGIAKIWHETAKAIQGGMPTSVTPGDRYYPKVNQ